MNSVPVAKLHKHAVGQAAVVGGAFQLRRNSCECDGTRLFLDQTMGGFGQSDELGGALLFLFNNKAASFITGVALPVDGDFSAYLRV